MGVKEFGCRHGSGVNVPTGAQGLASVLALRLQVLARILDDNVLRHDAVNDPGLQHGLHGFFVCCFLLILRARDPHQRGSGIVVGPKAGPVGVDGTSVAAQQGLGAKSVEIRNPGHVVHRTDA